LALTALIAAASTHAIAQNTQSDDSAAAARAANPYRAQAIRFGNGLARVSAPPTYDVATLENLASRLLTCRNGHLARAEIRRECRVSICGRPNGYRERQVWGEAV